MQLIDFAIIATVLLSVIIGGYRGFLRECIGLVVIIASLFIANLFATPATDWAAQWLPSDSARHISGFALIALVIYLLLSTITSMTIGRWQFLTPPSVVNLVAGAVYGVIRGVVLVVVASLVVVIVGADSQQWWLTSQFSPLLMDFNAWLAEHFAIIDSVMSYRAPLPR